jgi:hypothetical protein
MGPLNVGMPKMAYVGLALVALGVYKAIGSCSAFLWKGSPFSFESSWGERMICDKGDYLASVEKDLSQPYRIESSVFKKTYK